MKSRVNVFLFSVLIISLLYFGCGSESSIEIPAPGTEGYGISGTVTKDGGGVLQGVTITLSGPDAGSTITDNNGNYIFTGLANGSYTITPSLAGYVFNPVSHAVTMNGANITSIYFTASVSTGASYSISGTVTVSGGEALQGVTITLSGVDIGTTTTDASGSYTFPELANGSYTVTPSLAGYTFTPNNISVTVNNANVTSNFSAAIGS
jgi:hypothetical protein